MNPENLPVYVIEMLIFTTYGDIIVHLLFAKSHCVQEMNSPETIFG